VLARGPAGIAATLTARLLGLPTVGSYHTELAPTRGRARATRRSSCAPSSRWPAFYGSCDVVLSPSSSVDERLAGLGIATDRNRALGPRRRPRAVHADGGEPGPLRPGADQRPLRRRLTREKGADLLADAFLEGHRLRPAAAPRDRGRRP
jgi:hypothetical protein